jgi:curved DNA-binding protein CbpA
MPARDWRNGRLANGHDGGSICGLDDVVRACASGETGLNTSTATASDHYEVLQVSRKAHPLIIAKAYRLLVAFYHPDKPNSGDKEQFLRIVEAYGVLSDPVRRTRYDRQMLGSVPTNGGEAGEDALARLGRAGSTIENEGELRDGLLHALYTIRRNQPGNPGLSLMTLAELLGCSTESMQFALWYLRGKKLIEMVDDGNFAITVLGVDSVEARPEPGHGRKRLLMQSARRIAPASEVAPALDD